MLYALITLLVFSSLALIACQSASETAPPEADEPPMEEPTKAEEQSEAPTDEPTPEPTPEPPTVTPIPAGSNNADWEPVMGEFNGLPVIYVPAGCFTMGSTEEQIEAFFQESNVAYADAPFQPPERSSFEIEGPVHEVCLEAFWIGQMEVTNGQFAACVEAGQCTPPQDQSFFADPAFADHPVVNVTWHDALGYAVWLGASLPTEAQWEYAARGPEGWVYPWGSEFDGTRLNFCDANCTVYFLLDPSIDDGYELTAPVGTYPGGASWVGALDMSGNAREWTGSLFMPYPYDAADGREDLEAGGNRVMRGGDFNLNYITLRNMTRFEIEPDVLCQGIYGFRVVVSVEAYEAQ